MRLTQSDRARHPARRPGDAVMSAARDVSRRVFLETSGALLIGFALAPQAALSQDRPAALPGSLNTNRMLDAWLRIDPNGTVTIFTGKIELGQGIGTALAQIAADELDVNLERIQIVSGDTARTPNEGLTAGSLSMEQSGTARYPAWRSDASCARRRRARGSCPSTRRRCAACPVWSSSCEMAISWPSPRRARSRRFAPARRSRLARDGKKPRRCRRPTERSTPISCACRCRAGRE